MIQNGFLRYVPLLLLFACSNGGMDLPGGDLTLNDRTSMAFDNPAPNLSSQELDLHLEGDVIFDATFVTAPAPVNPGLGPHFNNTSCSACHLRNGRGLAVTGKTGSGSQLLIRVSQDSAADSFTNAPLGYAELGTQLQDHAIFGHDPKASIEISYTYEEGSFGDGEPFELRKPSFLITLANGSSLPSDALTSARIPSPMIGLGLLEAIDEKDLMANSDPDDQNGDGISGRLNYVWDVQQKKTVVGRFGWKANSPTILQQSAEAYVQDMGITNPLFFENESMDITQKTLDTAAFYVQSLAVPITAESTNASRRGKNLFAQFSCDQCHLPKIKTGHHPLAFLRDQTIAPYTDLLLHDMGPGLSDGRPDFDATGDEWRTAPLWGIGLTKTVARDATFLHDGRARTLSEAILWHQGEAEQSKEAYRNASKKDRDALITFLQTL